MYIYIYNYQTYADTMYVVHSSVVETIVHVMVYLNQILIEWLTQFPCSLDQNNLDWDSCIEWYATTSTNTTRYNIVSRTRPRAQNNVYYTSSSLVKKYQSSKEMGKYRETYKNL